MKYNQIEVLSTVTTTKHHTVKLTGEMVRELILKRHKIFVPSNAKVTFIVPSGGDWSGMRCDVTSDDPVWIEWDEETVEDKRS